ncbi:class IV adenylate cyclase [Streptomyces sp. CC210A]|uniref:class IV adenylate cyclase n=1 Tax=Streptomyces sp. CC210A TaxID=2898184 RepID=UPI001F4321BF|nr:class IV adenylate cyclase [Streptomyces sp. CC210A]
MIEAELKARVDAPEAVMKQLEDLAAGRAEVYQDTYYDAPDGRLEAGGQELRVRTIRSSASTRTVLTFKGAVVDEASGSKPEHETSVADAAAVQGVLLGLGYVPVISFEKHCRNYEFQAGGRRMLATLVRVPEIDGTFLEVETQAADDEVTDALQAVRAVLEGLGIESDALTRELYTDAVRHRRLRDGRHTPSG